MTETHVFAYFWVGICIAIGLFARYRYNRSGFSWFVISMVVSPLLGFLFVLAMGRRTPGAERKPVG